MGKRMINYSVYMMRNSLKPNLPEKAYAKAQVKEVMSFRDFGATSPSMVATSVDR